MNPEALANARQTSRAEGFDWDKLKDMVYRERLAPLLSSVTYGSNLLPTDLAATIRHTYLRYAVHNARQLQELGDVISTFDNENIDIIVLKGAALAETIYANIALRPMVDMDILIHRRDLEKAIPILNSLGYFSADLETHPGMITAYENELLLHKVGAGDLDIALELHWSLLDSPHYQQKLRMDWFWRTAQLSKIAGETALVLGIEGQLLHLCSHISLHHAGGGMLWLHDVAEVLYRHESNVNWNTLMAKAEEYDLVLSLQQVMNQVDKAWDLQLTTDMIDKLNQLQPSDREQQVFDWLNASDRPVAHRFWVDLATSKSWKRRIAYAWQNLLPSAGYMRQRYNIKHSVFLPFYYPYRWLRGLLSVFQ